MFWVIWLVLTLVYIGGIRLVAATFPARGYPLLRWLHWLSTGLILLIVVVKFMLPVGWVWRLPGPLSGLVLLSGLVAGVRARLKLTYPVGLSATQSVLIGLCVLVLFSSLWFPLGPPTSMYGDAHFAIAAAPESESDPYAKYGTALYRTRYFLFSQYVGTLARVETEPKGETWWQLPWWVSVSAMRFDSNTKRGYFVRKQQVIPFQLETGPAKP